MGDKSAIEWTEATWNPLVGCRHVSAGCDGCYAAREASGRLSGHALYRGLAVNGRFTGEVRTVPERLDQPLHWSKARRVFVNSMSDLFHSQVPPEFIAEVFAVMRLATQHTFQVLTKRPHRMERLLSDRQVMAAFDEQGPTESFSSMWRHALVRRGGDIYAYDDLPLPNVWLGTSVEDQETAERRIPHLLATPAAVRWLSIEPLLGKLDLWHLITKPCPRCDGSASIPVHGGGATCPDCFDGVQGVVPTVDWVVVGGESGPNARPMHPDWVKRIREECRDAGVPVFFKQWGEWSPEPPTAHRPLKGHRFPDGQMVYRHGKKDAGSLVDGREWKEYPQ